MGNDDGEINAISKGVSTLATSNLHLRQVQLHLHDPNTKRRDEPHGVLLPLYHESQLLIHPHCRDLEGRRGKEHGRQPLFFRMSDDGMQKGSSDAQSSMSVRYDHSTDFRCGVVFTRPWSFIRIEVCQTSIWSTNEREILIQKTHLIQRTQRSQNNHSPPNTPQQPKNHKDP